MLMLTKGAINIQTIHFREKLKDWQHGHHHAVYNRNYHENSRFHKMKNMMS